jgi:ElaB/YqjD/DUF883 family membrane-anchored ribosome-binding protein
MEFVMADAAQNQAHQGDIGSRIGDLKNAALDQMEKAGAQAERIAGSVADQARETGEQIREVTSTVDAAVRRSLNDQPLATLAVVAALGFVLGAVWKAR